VDRWPRDTANSLTAGRRATIANGKEINKDSPRRDIVTISMNAFHVLREVSIMACGAIKDSMQDADLGTYTKPPSYVDVVSYFRRMEADMEKDGMSFDLVVRQ
jgi:hypothetical protein